MHKKKIKYIESLNITDPLATIKQNHVKISFAEYMKLINDGYDALDSDLYINSYLALRELRDRYHDVTHTSYGYGGTECDTYLRANHLYWVKLLYDSTGTGWGINANLESPVYNLFEEFYSEFEWIPNHDYTGKRHLPYRYEVTKLLMMLLRGSKVREVYSGYSIIADLSPEDDKSVKMATRILKEAYEHDIPKYQEISLLLATDCPLAHHDLLPIRLACFILAQAHKDIDCRKGLHVYYDDIELELRNVLQIADPPLACVCN